MVQLLFISPHDGDVQGFWEERGETMEAFLHPEDSVEDFLRFLEIERDTYATALMKLTADQLRSKGIAVDCLTFDLPRGILDVNRWKFEVAQKKVWCQEAEFDPEFQTFLKELQCAHQGFLDQVWTHLKAGSIVVDWHTMGPYSEPYHPGNLRVYNEGYERTVKGETIDIIEALPRLTHRNILDAVRMQLREGEYANNQPYGASEAMKATSFWHLIHQFPGQMACWDVPKALLQTEKARHAMADRFARGIAFGIQNNVR